MFEFAGVQEIISFRYSDNLDSIEEASKLTYRVKYFGEWEDCDGVIHESSLDIIHGDLV